MSDSDCPLAVLLIGEKNGCDEDCVRETCECFANMAEGCRLTQQDMQTVGSEGVGHARVIIVPGGDVWPDSDDEEDSSYVLIPMFLLTDSIIVDLQDHLAQLAALGPEGSEVLSRAVRDDGAVYLGVCAGAFLAVELEAQHQPQSHMFVPRVRILPIPFMTLINLTIIPFLVSSQQ